MASTTSLSASRGVIGAVIGAVVGLVVGLVTALLGSFILLYLVFENNEDTWWARLLVHAPPIWIVLGGLTGAAIGLRIARRSDRAGLPQRPDET